MSDGSLPSNLVNRLRHSAAVNRSGGYDGDAEEREEAADEIERLRAMLHACRDEFAFLTESINTNLSYKGLIAKIDAVLAGSFVDTGAKDD